MESIIRPSRPDDLPQIKLLAIGAFGCSGDSPFIDDALMHWKYWCHRGDFAEPRGFVVEVDGRVSAHSGVWPLLVPGLAGAHMIDWMAAPDIPGVGALLQQDIQRRFDFLYSIGGTKASLGIIPSLGFRVIGTTQTWARPLRPFRQFLNRSPRGFLPGRTFLRNARATFPRRLATSGWKAVAANECRAPERDAEFFSYLRQCPSARVSTYLLKEQAEEIGVLAMSLVGLQARVAGIWLVEQTVANWTNALTLAQGIALEHSDACEIVFKGASEVSNLAAPQAGLRYVGSEELRSSSPDGNDFVPPVNFQFLDDDAFFLSSGRRGEFVT